MSITSFLSFDVEALPGRAKSDHVERLIWGRVDGQEWGIRRICSILDEYKIKGNFLLDMAGCVLYGDKAMLDVGNFIMSAGHELHVHLHSEWLIRKWGVEGDFNVVPGFNFLDEKLNKNWLNYSFFKYKQLFGVEPVLFRSGGFYFNEYTISAARAAGFACLSNFNSDRHADMIELEGMAADNEQFDWGGGF